MAVGPPSNTRLKLTELAGEFLVGAADVSQEKR